MKLEHGTFRVTRFCCTSGMCTACRAVANHSKRKRIVHMDNLSEASADAVAKNWHDYDAKVEATK